MNQTASYDLKTLFLIEECRKNLIDRIHFSIVTCFHTSILTNAINFAYTKEILLKNYHLGMVFNLLKTRVISKLIVYLYIRKNRKAYRVFYDRSDVLVVLCEGQRRELLKMLGLEMDNKIVVIPNSAPVEDYANIKEKSNIVLWVGQFSNNIKRPDWMLNIWEKVYKNNPSWTLYMLGDGEAFESVKNKIKKDRIKNVILTGRVAPQEYYERAKLMSVTSVHEAFPMVLMEAQQSMVVPIVYNSFTSASSIIKSGVNGYLIKPFDEDEFASKLDYLMNNEMEVERMRKEGKQMVKRYTKDNVYKLWEYEMVLLNNN